MLTSIHIASSMNVSKGNELYNNWSSAVELINSSEKVCFMGMSLTSNVFFSKAVVLQYADKFCKDNVPLIFFVADALEAFNYQYLAELNAKNSRIRARKVGENYFRGYCKISNKYPNFCPVLTSEKLLVAKLKKFNKFVESEYMTNDSFKTAVQKEVSNNLGDRIQPNLALAPKSKPKLERYVLGEIAISLMMYAMRKNNQQVVQISPNPNGILANLSSYENLLKSLNIAKECCDYMTWRPKE